MIHFNATLWNIHQLSVLKVLDETRQFQQEKQKNWPRYKFHDIVSDCHDIISIEPVEAMSQQAALCCNKDQAKLKPETKIVETSHNYVAT